MSHAALPVIFGAAALAMVGAFFGLCVARLMWADDLRHAQHLRQIWDESEKAMRETIEIQQRRIEFYERGRAAP